jgi:nucleoside-diphosphate-sugar epimerase
LCEELQLAADEMSKSLVIGATGLVGSYLLQHLARSGQKPYAMSRSPHTEDGADWIVGDLENMETLPAPGVATLYCTTDAKLLAPALQRLLTPSLRRVVAFSSTSVMTKMDSEIAGEREAMKRLAEAEEMIGRTCEAHSVAWTILRPTIIYAEGRDQNLTPLSRLIGRFGFMPVVGGGPGLRQPVHAEDLALGAIAAAETPATANKIYALPGADTLSYREMIGRIFDGMKMPRRIVPIPELLWRAVFVWAGRLFPGANVAMGIRMMQDMAFDARAAVADFGWQPRGFHPMFDQTS